jgi:DNA-binding response OmpR family regulator
MKKILLVEDDMELNKAYGMILKQDKYDVRSAYNGEDALQILEDFNPNLILLDLIMPVKSGLEFLEEYSSKNRKLPKILIITNVENSNEITKALTFGGLKCVVKSHTTPQGLRKIVRTTLASKG